MSYAGIDIGFGYTKMSFNGKNFYFKTVVEPYIHSDKVFNENFSVIYVNNNGYLLDLMHYPKEE